MPWTVDFSMGSPRIAKRRSVPSWAFALCIALLTCACQGEGEERDFHRLERLIFIPEAPCILFPETRTRVDCSNPRPLVVDRFEVTRGEWSRWLESGPQVAGLQASQEQRRDGEARHPATDMTLDEAREFAASEGMRLPTAREWLRIAVGTRAQFFPWKPVPHASVANTDDLGLAHLSPVGTFEAGRTPAGVYDMLGNAAEWVVQVEVGPERALGDLRTWAMGGSYLSRKRATYRFDPEAEGSVTYNAWVLDPASRSNDVGLRLVADAESWLRERAAGWETDKAGAARLKLVGESWGQAAAPLLRRLSEESGAAPALKFLLLGAQS